MIKKRNNFLAELTRIIDSFESEEALSQFELGQCDAMRWIKQTLEEDYGTEDRSLQSEKRPVNNLGK